MAALTCSGFRRADILVPSATVRMLSGGSAAAPSVRSMRGCMVVACVTVSQLDADRRAACAIGVLAGRECVTPTPLAAGAKRLTTAAPPLAWPDLTTVGRKGRRISMPAESMGTLL